MVIKLLQKPVPCWAGCQCNNDQPSVERVLMLNIEQARKIEPELASLTDEQVLEVLNDIYGLSQLAFEKWQNEVFQKSH